MKSALKTSTLLAAALAAVMPAIAGCGVMKPQHHYNLSAEQKKKIIAAIQNSHSSDGVKAAEIKNVQNAP